MDDVSQKRIMLVAPRFRALVTELIAQVWEEFHCDLRVTQGLRSWEEQDLLYAQGRGLPGEKVTDARGGYSWHNFGLAVDVVPMVPRTDSPLVAVPDWDSTHAVWKAIVDMGTALGMDAGAHWHHPDGPHFQYTGIFPVTPDDIVRGLYKQSGIQGVWERAFAPIVDPGTQETTA